MCTQVQLVRLWQTLQDWTRWKQCRTSLDTRLDQLSSKGVNPLMQWDLHVTNAAVLPVGYRVGDHWTHIIDITQQSLIGSTGPTIQWQQHWQLNTKLPQAVEKYNNKLTDLFESHWCLEWLHSLLIKGTDESKMQVAESLACLDTKVADCMQHAERNCQKIKNGAIVYSPKAEIWIWWVQIYGCLLRQLGGHRGNQGNLIQAGWRCGINHRMHLSKQDIQHRIAVHQERCDYFRIHSPQYHWEHLSQRLSMAQSQQDEVAQDCIWQIISQEQWQRQFATLQCTTGWPRGCCVSSVQVENGRHTTEVSTKTEVTEVTLLEVHNKQNILAAGAPLCQEEFDASCARGVARYLQPQTVGSGNIRHPYANCNHMYPDNAKYPFYHHNTTRMAVWLEEGQQMYIFIQIEITLQTYKASIASDYLVHFHATKTTVALTLGLPYPRWQRRVTVMLEKELGVNLVLKLQAILLMEADFNSSNKNMFGNCMLQSVRQHALMPEEISSEQGWTAVDRTLAKVLFYNISRQLHRPAVIASVDASNCFDCICHSMASLIFQSTGVPPMAAKSMLGAIAEMKFSSVQHLGIPKPLLATV